MDINIKKKSNQFVYFDDRQSLENLNSATGEINKLPSISIACSPKCDLLCPHCIYSAGEPNKNPLSVDEKKNALEQAVNLGAMSLQICHEGEPILDPAVLSLIEIAYKNRLKVFMYTNGAGITKEIADFLFYHQVRLGVKFDSMNPDIFNKMIGANKSLQIFNGIENLLKAGYNKPILVNGNLVTWLSLVVTLTSLNTGNINDIKNIAKYCWENNIFFGAARLEKGGRAIDNVWKTLRIPEKEKVIELIDWCSVQTGIDYWNAQPNPYCIGVAGMQISDNGNVWITKYGGSCDFTEPDGESYPEDIVTIGNIRNESLEILLEKLWVFRKKVYENGSLDKKLMEYEKLKDVYPNGLQDCGSARTYTLFEPFYNYISNIIKKNYI